MRAATIGERPLERVGVELLLVQLAHKRRKESTSAAAQTPLGACDVPVNPSEDHPPSLAPAVAVPADVFNLQADGNLAKTYTLVVRVHNSPVSQVRRRLQDWSSSSCPSP